MPPPASHSPVADLVLNPAARVLWRGTHTVQLELGGRTVVVDGVDRDTVRTLLRREHRQRGSADAAEPHLPAFDAEALEKLIEDGFLWTAPPGTRPLAPPPSALFGADLTSLAARYGMQASRVLAARQACTVAIAGRGRAAVQIGALLAAAGVGRVHFVDSGDVHLSQTMPGGLPPQAEGHRFASTAAAVVRAAAPEVDTTPVAGQTPHLTVLAVNEPVDSDQRNSLHERDCAHLVVRLAPGSGVVGPLVVPGRTSCLRCADLHRRDRDPAWNALAVQLTITPHRGAASEVGVAALLGAVASLQALAFLDTGRCAAMDGTIEVLLPDWRLRRRTWPVHPDCGCGSP